MQRAAVPIIRPIMVGTSLPCFGCINLARVATLMTPMITPNKNTRGRSHRLRIHGPKPTITAFRFGSWLSWPMGSTVDPVALRRHLSEALPFRRSFLLAV